MDFIIGFPPTKIRTGEVANTILVIVNRYIKFLGYFATIITSRTGRSIFRTIALI